MPSFILAKEAIEITPSSVRQMIGREKVVAFSKDYLIKSGLDEKDLTKWESIIQKSRSFITPDKKGFELKNSDQLLYILDNAYTFVKTAVPALHTTFRSFYVKKGDKYIPEINILDEQQKMRLKTFNRQAQELKEKVLSVAQTAFPRSYIDEQEAPDTWVKTYLKNKDGKLLKAEEVFPLYKEFLTDYTASNMKYEVFQQNFGAKYGLIANKNDKNYAKKYTELLEQIERCHYRLGEKTLSILEQKNRGLLKKIANEIRNEIPDIYTSLDFYIIAKSHSMERTVLSSYAEAMEGVLNQIIRETDLLLKSIIQ